MLAKVGAMRMRRSTWPPAATEAAPVSPGEPKSAPPERRLTSESRSPEFVGGAGEQEIGAVAGPRPGSRVQPAVDQRAVEDVLEAGQTQTCAASYAPRSTPGAPPRALRTHAGATHCLPVISLIRCELASRCRRTIQQGQKSIDIACLAVYICLSTKLGVALKLTDVGS